MISTFSGCYEGEILRSVCQFLHGFQNFTDTWGCDYYVCTYVFRAEMNVAISGEGCIGAHMNPEL